MHVNRILNRRGGFTLLELLVVMTIILTLSGLLLAAIFKALSMAEKLAQVSDIKGLHEGVTAFKTYFDVEYMPSQIMLYPTPPAQDDAFGSVAYIRRLFPNPGFAKKWQQEGMNWGAGGNQPLQGHECLVFFLGGPQRPDPSSGKPKPMGWGTDPSDPCREGGGRKSFYDFPIEKLSTYGSGWATFRPKANNEIPYAYFSKKTAMNSYSPGDCSMLGVSAYGSPMSGFMNADSYQIIGPGVDLKFGAGGSNWSPTRPYLRGDPGYDDLANFYGTATLGSGQ